MRNAPFVINSVSQIKLVNSLVLIPWLVARFLTSWESFHEEVCTLCVCVDVGM